MAKVQQCADCHRTLTPYEAMYHVCPQQLRANRRAQARQRQQAAVPVLRPREKCRCGADATECMSDGTLLCARCYQDELDAGLDAARDAAELRNEVQREPRR